MNAKTAKPLTDISSTDPLCCHTQLFTQQRMNLSCAECSDEELLSILRGKLRREQLTAGVSTLMAAADVLRKKRATASHFGNGGEVANLLSEAKLRKENRRGNGSVESRRVVEYTLRPPSDRPEEDPPVA